MIVKERFTMATRGFVPKLQSKMESVACGVKTGVPALEEGPHVGRNEGVRQAIERSFVLVVAQMESASRTEIDNLTAADIATDA